MSVISQFWGNTMDGIRRDLIILRGIQSPQYGTTCATATAMLCFSTMDYIGYLIGTHENPSDPEKSIYTILSSEEKMFPPCYWDSDVPLAFCMLYRHEIMHHGFPAEWGIGKVSKEWDNCLFFMCGGRPSLNVNKLTDDLLKAIDILQERTADEKSAFSQHLTTRIQELEKHGRRDRKKKPRYEEFNARFCTKLPIIDA